jgi:hypothetical protein
MCEAGASTHCRCITVSGSSAQVRSAIEAGISGREVGRSTWVTPKPKHGHFFLIYTFPSVEFEKRAVGISAGSCKPEPILK